MNSQTPAEMSVEELESRFKKLTQKGADLERSKLQIEAALDERRRSLKTAMEQAKADGFNPDKLQDEIRHGKEVLAAKLDIYESELDAAEKALRPMHAEIQKG